MSKEDREVLDMANGVQAENQGERKPAQPVKQGSSVPRWMRTDFRRMLSEVAGWTGFGGVVMACMLAGCCPMGVAVPVFVGCFAWVAIQLDRYFRR